MGERYVGLDDHMESCTFGVVGPSGKRLMSTRRATEAPSSLASRVERLAPSRAANLKRSAYRSASGDGAFRVRPGILSAAGAAAPEPVSLTTIQPTTSSLAMMARNLWKGRELWSWRLVAETLVERSRSAAPLTEVLPQAHQAASGATVLRVRACRGLLSVLCKPQAWPMTRLSRAASTASLVMISAQ